MKTKKYLLILNICFLFFLTSCNFDDNDKLNNETNINIEDEIPEGIILSNEEKEIGKELISSNDNFSYTNTDINKNDNDNALSNLTNPYDEYDKFISKEKNFTINEAKDERLLNGFMIAFSTTDNMMEVTSFDDYTQIALLYFVNLGGYAKDVYDNCTNEEEVREYLIEHDDMGKLKFSTILNEHKFEY